MLQELKALRAELAKLAEVADEESILPPVTKMAERLDPRHVLNFLKFYATRQG